MHSSLPQYNSSSAGFSRSELLLHASLQQRSAILSRYLEAMDMKPGTLSGLIGDTFKKVVANMLEVPPLVPQLEDNLTHQKFDKATEGLKQLAATFDSHEIGGAKSDLTLGLRSALIESRIAYLQGRSLQPIYRLRYEYPAAEIFGLEGDFNSTVLRSRRLTEVINRPAEVRKILIEVEKSKFSTSPTQISAIWNNREIEEIRGHFLHEKCSREAWTERGTRLVAALEIIGIPVTKTYLRTLPKEMRLDESELLALLSGQEIPETKISATLGLLYQIHEVDSDTAYKINSYVLNCPTLQANSPTAQLQDLARVPGQFESLIARLKTVQQEVAFRAATITPLSVETKPSFNNVSPGSQPTQISILPSGTPEAVATSQSSVKEHRTAVPPISGEAQTETTDHDTRLRKPRVSKTDTLISAQLSSLSEVVVAPVLKPPPRPPELDIYWNTHRHVVEQLVEPCVSPVLDPRKGLEFRLVLASTTLRYIDQSDFAKIAALYKENQPIYLAGGSRFIRETFEARPRHSEHRVLDEMAWHRIFSVLDAALPGFTLEHSAREKLHGIFSSLIKMRELASVLSYPEPTIRLLSDAIKMHGQNVASSSYLAANPTCLLSTLSSCIVILTKLEMYKFGPRK